MGKADAPDALHDPGDRCEQASSSKGLTIGPVMGGTPAEAALRLRVVPERPQEPDAAVLIRQLRDEERM